MQLSLNGLFSDYLSGEILRDQFEGLIYNYLVHNQEKTCLSHWKRDEYEDYLSWFYPRLHKAIDTYQDVGSSFEAFAARFLLVSSKEYRVRITSKAVTEYSAWSAQVPDMYAHEEPPVYIHKSAEKMINDLTIDKKGRKNTRCVLALLLKCYNYVSEDFAEKVAPKLGMDKKELLAMLKKIREIRQDRDDAVYFMQERINTQFLRCIVYERKMMLLKEDANAYAKLKSKHERARARLEKMRERIRNIRTDATNKQVAEIIGISKGTVDASLYKLRTRMQVMSEKALAN